jgi:hypothetical protein
MIKVRELIQHHFRGFVPARRMSTVAAMKVSSKKVEPMPSTFNHSEDYEVAIKFCVRYIVHRDTLNDLEFADAKKYEQAVASKALAQSIYGDIVYKLSRILYEAKYQSRDIDDPLVEEIQKLLEEVEGTMK